MSHVDLAHLSECSHVYCGLTAHRARAVVIPRRDQIPLHACRASSTRHRICGNWDHRSLKTCTYSDDLNRDFQGAPWDSQEWMTQSERSAVLSTLVTPSTGIIQCRKKAGHIPNRSACQF
jgi:hypothetical protein